MRVIKFRGYCDRDSEWRFGSYATDGVNHEILTPLGNGHLYSSVIGRDDIDSIGQFTGLLDKNGVEIYEGDIVTVDGSGICEVKICSYWGVVYVDSDGYERQHADCVSEQDYPTVIGNIHETPELLK